MNYRPSLRQSAIALPFVLSLVFSTQVFAQSTIGRQKVDRYPVTSWGFMSYGLTWLPTDYASNTAQKYPLIIFLHGKGETGDGVGGLYTLIGTGLPQLIANGFNPEAVNPADGQNYKFIVVSPQAPSSMQWSYDYSHVKWILQDVMSRYRVDPDRIYVTGLSAGGQGTWSCVTSGPDAQKFAAIVPVSSANGVPSDSIPKVGSKYGVRLWEICGDQDGFWGFTNASTSLYNSGSPLNNAIATGIPGQGHWSSAWNLAYSPSFRQNGHNKNIYEWMLQYKRNGNSSNVDQGNGNQNITANAGPDQTLTLPVNSLNLNGWGNAPGNSTHYAWKQVSGPNTASWNNTGVANPFVSNLVAGTYVFRLTVTNNNGNGNNGASDDVTVTVNPAPVNKVPTANAGTAQNITLPVSSVNLNGSASDPDGSIASYQWSKVSGPNTPSFGSAGSAATSVSGLVEGTYSFRLTVKDNAGASVSSDVNVTVNAAPVDNDAASSTAPSSRIEAESWSDMKGVKTENTADDGGGKDVYDINNGEWMEYVVTVPSAGTYTLNLRVATSKSGAELKVGKQNGTILATLDIPNTGGDQKWKTISTSINLSAGRQVIRVASTENPKWNFNWMELLGETTPPPSASSSRIEAENWNQMKGVKTEVTQDKDGGLDVANINNGDWMEYTVNVPSAGFYTLNLRVATSKNGAELKIGKQNGTILSSVKIPNTGDGQSWKTISTTVALTAGQQIIRVASTEKPEWNFNWMELAGGTTPSTPASSRIEAESWNEMKGVKTEKTSDDGGGLDVYDINNGEWMEYYVNVPSAGTYTLNLRVAASRNGAELKVGKQNGTILSSVKIPNTGGDQNWKTISTSISLSAGRQVIRVASTENPKWNFNWMELAGGIASEAGMDSRSIAENLTTEVSSTLNIYPNPVQDRIQMLVNNTYSGALKVQLINIAGAVVKEFSLTKPARGAFQSYLSIGDMQQGAYILKLTMNEWTETKKLIKQ